MSVLYFNSRAHVERDREQKYYPGMYLDFNSRAHVERDGRTIRVGPPTGSHFNSRAHVERDV